MKYLGIDYGEKRVGIAVSDEDGIMAFPLDVLSNDKRLVTRIREICKREKAEAIVIGESKDLAGKDNAIMPGARSLVSALKKEVGLPVSWESELFTSAEAERIQGKHGMLDASAAAIILKSYLDKKVSKLQKNKK